ncbi:hypothetical protein JMM63_15230 [Rhodovulum sulfidophilum]|uniref:Uncharacterized protein n=1 Tax=Rhodovulum sulfidophilum TaxID=35806 RepID=A0ABS1RR69_RHOSU|nr:hypothetical protein [Rhodovulum sulfidophilum]MBK5925115.1 hypothetical protein [Rhodovulum sulfidophilum]MBL3584223.1 hypothetical protein [Rhodovulum sulfidophilum]MBL3596901.1 hypothetical protein [Rhodovulum sulfidophilum]MBL3607509.1 hypothetical protein [Rhodovulum sulfidophilum]MCE8418940.1 hypothetical protein [Rhodovulum sulfidophilum]
MPKPDRTEPSCRSLCTLPPAQALPILAVALAASVFLWIGLGAGLLWLGSGGGGHPALPDLCSLGLRGLAICGPALAALVLLARRPQH